ncbi:hypothetical protein K1T71_013835 [Dendrolimus kikuchii]|uniref:Uncharacterized protein n=1 Tax=Dendrolimus kikuchii TaxID=765133 RepID=A0ACC1CFX9_9NEOP|nr:hypothetical protein K1T71_013835 [Dendrolimus kikuchii]
MSTTMRPTLQTVPESLPADHVTTPAPAPAAAAAAPAPSQPRHPRPIFKTEHPFVFAQKPPPIAARSAHRCTMQKREPIRYMEQLQEREVQVVCVHSAYPALYEQKSS